MKNYTTWIIALSFAFFSAHSLAGDSFHRKFNDAGYSLRDKIWDTFSEIEIYEKSTDDFDFKIQLKRNIVDNLDGRTHTVTDRIIVPMSAPLFSDSIGTLSSANIPVNFGVGVSGNLELINIRTVERDDKVFLDPHGENLKDKIQVVYDDASKDIQDDAVTKLESGQEIVVEEGTTSKIGNIEVDSLRHARYHRFLNRIAFPMRIPIKAQDLDQLANQEVMKFLASGTFSFGPSISQNFGSIPMSASLKFFSKGQFEVAVMPLLKKTKRKVWVKVRRLRGKGVTVGIGGRQVKELDAVAILGTAGVDASGWGDNLLGEFVMDEISDLLKFEVIPIRSSLTREKQEILEIGYEFDLENEMARHAYEKMILGKTDVADHLAIKYKGKENAPVVLKFDKVADEKIRSTNQKIKITFLREKTKSCQNKISDGKVEFPDGTHSEIRAVSYCSVEQTGLTSGKKHYSFNFEGGYTRNRKTGKQQMGLFATGNLVDYATTGKELRRYTDKVNTLLGGKILPTLPVKKNEEEVINYGYTSIKLVMGLSQRQLGRYIIADEKTFCEATVTAFKNYDNEKFSIEQLCLRGGASKFGKLLQRFITFIPRMILPSSKSWRVQLALYDYIDGWQKLRKRILGARSFTDEVALGAMDTFRKDVLGNALFAEEYMAAMLLTIGKQGPLELNYELTASGDAYGSAVQYGTVRSVARYDQQLKRFNELKAFDNPQLYLDMDSQATTSGVRVTVKGDMVKLSFNITKSPRYLRIQLKRNEGWGANNNEFDFFVLNNNQIFKPGPVYIERSIQQLLKATNKRIKPGDFYKIGVAVSNDGERFGILNYSKEFRLPKSAKASAPKPRQESNK